MSDYRVAFETVLQRDPCDTTTRLIFADWLEENGYDDEAVEHRRRATPEWIASYQWMVAFANRGGDHCENYGAGWEEYRQKTNGLDWQNLAERALIEAADQEMHETEIHRVITIEDCIQAGYSFINDGEHFVQMGNERLRDNFTDEFWQHWCMITGDNYRQPEQWEWGNNPFSCSC